MVMDLSVELIHATVQLEQPLGDGTRTVGTGFLIQSTAPDGAPRTVLVTANHVLAKMPGKDARIGYRIANADGSWSYSPQTLRIRDEGGGALWTRHPSRDVAAISITAPAEFAKAAIPLNWLAEDDTLAANQAGFPILRAGRVASFPVAPAQVFPTFLLDFTVFPGNSGGPVFMSQAARKRVGAAEPQEVQFIAGLLTQQVELNNERLEIGIVTHAKFIRETLALMDNPLAPVTVARSEPVVGAKAASAEEAVARD
jgi:V8-like Glu-specific endopeptidase